MLNITGVKPMFNNILTTMNKYEKDEYENGIIIYKKDNKSNIMVRDNESIC